MSRWNSAVGGILQVLKFQCCHSQCYRQWLFKAPRCITLKIEIWAVAYFFNFFKLFLKKTTKFIKYILCNFSMRMLKCFLKKFKFFLPTKSWKNHPQKLLRITQIHFFFLTAWAAQTAQTEEFMFRNVVYRPTVYRTGLPLSSP